MGERQYSHRLGKNETGYLSEIAATTDAANASGVNRQPGTSSPGNTGDWFYNELSVPDTGLAEIWMELRM